MGSLGSTLQSAVDTMNGESEFRNNTISAMQQDIERGKSAVAGAFSNDNAWERLAARGAAYWADDTNKKLEKAKTEPQSQIEELPEPEEAKAVDAEKLMNATKAPDAQEMLYLLMQKAGGK